MAFGLSDRSTDSTASDASCADDTAEVAKALGATVVRLNIYWAGIEPVNNQMSWSRTDNLYWAFVKRGIRPVLDVLGTPRWAVSPADYLTCPPNGQGTYCSAEPDVLHEAQLNQLGAALAQRYPLAGGFEYRNEPNIPQSGVNPPHPDCSATNPAVTAAKYATDLTQFYNGVKGVRPAMHVIGGALSFCGDVTSWVTNFLQAAGNKMDALSLHPYDQSLYASPTDPGYLGTMQNRVGLVTDAMDATGYGGLRLYASEFGAQGSRFSFNEAAVAERVIDQYHALDGSIAPDGSDVTIPKQSQFDGAAFFTTAKRSEEIFPPDNAGAGEFGFTTWGAVRQPLPVFCRVRPELGSITAPFLGYDGILFDVAPCP